MNFSEKLHLRPHHALCVVLFNPKGHSQPYIEIMEKLTEHLESNPKKKIVLSDTLDITCNYCPHNDFGVCQKADETAEIVKNILELCGLNIGGEIIWENLRERVIDNIIAVNLLDKTCNSCSYLAQCIEQCGLVV